MVKNNQESRRKYWATRSSVHLFTHKAHSFACSAVLASLMHSAALTHSQACGKLNHWMLGNQTIMNHSGMAAKKNRRKGR